MSDYLSIVRAVYSGLSQREVAKTHQVYRNTVALLLRQAKSLGWLTQEDLKDADPAALSGLLGKERDTTRDATFKLPDYNYVHAELAKPHVTLHLLWEEYVESSRQEGSRFYMETQFRHYYHKFARVHKATIRWNINRRYHWKSFGPAQKSRTSIRIAMKWLRRPCLCPFYHVVN